MKFNLIRLLGISSIFVFVLVFIASCEKVIEIPLDAAPTQTVIEAELKAGEGNNYVLISKSSNVYEQSDFPHVSGAEVTITDKDGVVYLLEETIEQPGKYVCPTLGATINNEYNLSVNIDGEIFTAYSETYKRPLLDSLTVRNTADFGFGDIFDARYTVSFHASDHPDEQNYYQAVIWVNGEKTTARILADDSQLGGAYFTGPFFTDMAYPGDSIQVELISMDRGMYDFQSSVGNAGNSAPFQAAPSNPTSNLVGENVLGYFGAMMTDTLTTIIPD